jgi:hypothetical protein
MSTVKITELPLISTINANTANTLFLGVDLPSLSTGKMTVTTLAQGLYSNNALVVGQSNQQLPNTVASFSLSGDSYVQTNFFNSNDGGTADHVITANSGSGGTDSKLFIDMGFANKNYVPGSEFNNIGTAIHPLDGYLYAQGNTNTSPGGNLIVGTTTSNTSLKFIVGGGTAANIVAYMSSNSLVMNTQSYITFADGTTQTTAGATNAYSIAAFAQANSAAANTVVSQGVNSTQNTNIQSAWTQANLANSIANTAVQNTTTISVRNLNITGNMVANTLDTTVSFDNISSNNATFSKDVVILGQLTANTLLGNVFFSNVVTGTSQANSILWYPQVNSPTQSSGQVWYSANTISLVQDTDVAGDRPAISKVLFERVYNNTGSSIPNSSWVRLAGGVTANAVPYIQLADAGSAANSVVEGFIKQSIANGAYGFVYTRGIVSDLDASTFGTNGQLLFLSTTPGQATNVAPTGANSVVGVAKILSNGSANGKLQVAIANQQAYGKPNGAILFANNNLIQASNTLFINETIGQLNVSSTLYAANGIIYASRTYPSTQTAITISMTTDTWVRANVGASLGVTVSNFAQGTEVDVILTNPNTGGGSNRTITHGCSAINSSVGATTFVLSGTTTAFLKYYSFGADLANTYVKVSYS